MRSWFVTAAILGGLAVIAGAIGAHAPRDLPSPARGAINTAAAFQMYHALALGLTALVMRNSAIWAPRAAWAFLVGIILFSGSLYLWAVTGQHVLGFITPIGGLALIIGWGLLAVAGAKLEA